MENAICVWCNERPVANPDSIGCSSCPTIPYRCTCNAGSNPHKITCKRSVQWQEDHRCGKKDYDTIPYVPKDYETMKISIVAAMGSNRTIGLNNKIPWYLPEDFAFFKELTIGKPIIMGRKTFNSLPKILPKRKHLVVSRDPNYDIVDPQCTVYHSLEDLIKGLKKLDIYKEAYIIGGAEIYKQALELDLVDRIYLTLINKDFEGDTFFPEFDMSKFKLIQQRDGTPYEGLEFSFNTYEKY